MNRCRHSSSKSAADMLGCRRPPTRRRCWPSACEVVHCAYDAEEKGRRCYRDQHNGREACRRMMSMIGLHERKKAEGLTRQMIPIPARSSNPTQHVSFSSSGRTLLPRTRIPCWRWSRPPWLGAGVPPKLNPPQKNQNHRKNQKHLCY